METSGRIEPFLIRILATAFAVGCSIVVGEGLYCLEIRAPYLIFVPAIVLSCAIGGFGTALWAIFFSAMGLWYFFVPPQGFAWPGAGEVGHILVFIGVSIFMCWVIDSFRRSNDELTRDNVILGSKISILLNRRKTL